MSKNLNVVESELKARFDAALAELDTIDEEALDLICHRFNIETYKTESKSLLPEEIFTTHRTTQKALTPAEVKVLINKHLKTIPKGFVMSAHYNGVFVKKTSLFKHRNHKANKLRQTINLKLLIEAAGRSKKYFEEMVWVIQALECAKNNQDVPYRRR